MIRRAADVGHPSRIKHAVSKDLQLALERHMLWSEQTLVEYRMDWHRKKLTACERPGRTQNVWSAKRDRFGFASSWFTVGGS